MVDYIYTTFFSRGANRKYSFAGVVRECWVVKDVFGDNIGISQRWNEETQKRYAEYYNQRILPMLDNSVALEDFSKDYFILVIDRLKDRYKSEDTTNDHYEHLIKVVCEAGERFLKIPNCWVDRSVEDNTDNETTQGKIIPKSFSDEEEFAICKELMKPVESITGEYLGLLLMLVCGLRNGEAAGINFGDIYKIKGYNELYCLKVRKQSMLNSNNIDFKLKTKNGYRIIPLVDVFIKYICKYRNYIEGLIDKGDLKLPDLQTIDDLPIAHRKNNYLKRCSSADLSKAGQDLFIKLGYREDNVKNIHISDVFLYESKGKDFPVEKDPTTYILRRNFATRIKGLGFTEAEIHNCMGHSLINDMIPKFIFSNYDIQYEMAKKLKLNPLNIRANELL